MVISNKDIQRLSELALIDIETQYIETTRDSIDAIIGMVAQLQSVDTDKVEPLLHPIKETQNLRQDIVTEIDQRALFQGQAPEVAAGLFLVPKVIK